MGCQLNRQPGAGSTAFYPQSHGHEAHVQRQTSAAADDNIEWGVTLQSQLVILGRCKKLRLPVVQAIFSMAVARSARPPTNFAG